ncbi:hypothetical protein D9M72_524210 [compost metagenome]
MPELAGVTPKSVSATFERPEPTRPAMPRISPARTSKETSRKTPSSVRFFTERTTSPIGTSSFGNIWVISRPTIMRMMSSRVTLLEAWVPINLPSRNTENSSAISNSSFILWVM